MKKKPLKMLNEIVGEEQMKAYNQRNKQFKEDFMSYVKNLTTQKYGEEPVIDVVVPRNPFIDSRVLIVPQNPANDQKYDLLQTFGGGYITTVDVVSLPESLHENIYQVYVNEILGQMPWYYVTGGHLEFKKDNDIKIYSQSGDFGKSMAGYDVNSIAAYILGMTNKFNNIEVEKEGKLNVDADEFFDMWLRLFIDNLGVDNYIKEACRMHKEKSSPALRKNLEAEVYIRAMNDERSEKDIFYALTQNMFEVQREVFQEAIEKHFKNKE